MEKKKTTMLEGSPVRLILKFFFPIMFGSIFQQLYNTVDAIVVGNFVGKEALGAVGGSTGTVINLLVGFVVGLSSGATVVIAQYFGNHEAEGVKKGVDASMFLAMTLGLVLMVFGIWATPTVLSWMQVPADIFDFSVAYMRIFLAGMIPTLIYNNGAGILRAVGDSRRPLYFLIASCITNIVLDVVFVAGMHMGVNGAAWATVIAQVVSAALTLYVLSASNTEYAFHLRKMQVDWNILKRIVVIGFPVGIQACLYSIANLFIQVGVNGYGTDTVAAWTVFGKIDAIFWNTSGAIGQAVLTFAGQNFGAGNVPRVKKGVRSGLAIYIVMALLISAFCWFAGEFMLRLFTPDQNVITIGLKILQYMCPLWVVFSFVEVYSSTMRACGDSFVPMIITALGIGAFRILWILFVPSASVFDTIRCYPISWTLTSLLFIVYYLQGGWLKRSMKQRENLMNAN